MIFFDILTIGVLIWMVINGIKNGLVAQIFSLLGIIAGVALAIGYGDEVGSAFGFAPQYTAVAGFLIILFTTLIVATLVAKLFAKLLSAIGLDWANTLLGVLFAIVKGLVVLSMLYAAIFNLNERFQLIDTQRFDESVSFNIVRKVAQPLLEYWETTVPTTTTTTTITETNEV